MKYLVSDIGGTKTILATFKEEGGELKLCKEKRFVSHEYESLEDIIEAFLSEDGETIDRACFGIAGPIEDGVCRLTNLPWVVRAEEIKNRFGIEKVFLINDLVANAYGIRTLKEKDFYTINKGNPNVKGNQALISAGTGLGECPILYHKGELIPTPSEGGHCDFGPRSDLEYELLKYLEKKYGHVSYERILSGQGLINLFDFLRESKKESAEPEVISEMKEKDPAKVITEHALKGKSKICKKALEWFCSIYGAEAGNLALKIMALGGLYIGGGIAPKILSELKKEEFLAAFLRKGRFSELLENIPVHVVLEENTALRGAAFFCHNA